MGQFIDFRYVKLHADFLPVLARYGVELEGRGDERKALCPFHEETKASFKVNVKKGIFHCFGCDERGNVLDFVAKLEGCDLREAATIVAECSGIALSERTAGSKGSEKRPEKPVEREARGRRGSGHPKKPTGASEPENGSEVVSAKSLNETLSFSLRLDPEHPYGEERGLSPEAIEHFEMGFCERGMMKGRWCFPIHNPDGEVVAYAGRWVDEEMPNGVERYLLPPKFGKSLELFNLHRAIALNAEDVTIVEGYFGAVRLHMLGVSTVALMGTSMSDKQVELLVQAGVQRITLLLDGDDAGRKACERLLPLLARKFFVRVGVLPDGEAPDDCEEEVLLELVETVW